MELEKGMSFFRREDVMVLFTTSLAGLGHQRVTEALRAGLPPGIRSELIGIDDRKIQFLHRFTSRNRFLRTLTEFVQSTPFLEEIFVKWFRKRLWKDADNVFIRISDLVKRRRPKPEVLFIISTHHSLAHKIAAVKSRLAKELRLCVLLCVVVTDDSPQKIWGVFGADYIFAPSKLTRQKLIEYLSTKKLPLPKVFSSPYPVSPKFTQELPLKDFQERKSQLSNRKVPLRIIIPVSGAAVQLSYFKKIITYLGKKNNARFTVVSRESKFTKDFLAWCQDELSVEVIADRDDGEVVHSYEYELAQEVYSLEITKPSEQTFKTLLSPRERGGVILLFSPHVGRQENDNLNFLVRHELVPDPTDQEILNKLFMHGEKDKIDSGFLQRARKWRGILLPTEGAYAGRAILRLKESGILLAMSDFSGHLHQRELKGDGVRRFWKRLSKESKTECSFLLELK